MLRIPDNISDYFAYQLKLSKNKKVENVTLDKLDICLKENSNFKDSNKHDKQPDDFQKIFELEIKKYR